MPDRGLIPITYVPFEPERLEMRHATGVLIREAAKLIEAQGCGAGIDYHSARSRPGDASGNSAPGTGNDRRRAPSGRRRELCPSGDPAQFGLGPDAGSLAFMERAANAVEAKLNPTAPPAEAAAS